MDTKTAPVNKEPVVRFCPGCGSVGDVDAKYRDCCPDGNKARVIPKELAEHCSRLFNLALENAAPAQPVKQEPVAWIAVSDRLPTEKDGEVLVRMADGRPEIAWATYWHGSRNDFAQWTFRDPDEDETPTHWMPIPINAAPVERQWVDLTDDEIDSAIRRYTKTDRYKDDFRSYRAVIAAFKEKNK